MLQILVGLVAVGGHDGAADAASKCLQLKAARSQRPPAGQCAIFGGGAEYNILERLQSCENPGEVWSGKSNLGAEHHRVHCVGDQSAQVHHSLWSQLLQSRPHLPDQGVF